MPRIQPVEPDAWNVTEVMRVGYVDTFVARLGMVLNPLAERPGVVGANLQEVPDQIIEVEVGSWSHW